MNYMNVCVCVYMYVCMYVEAFCGFEQYNLHIGTVRERKKIRVPTANGAFATIIFICIHPIRD